jgi:FAD/FMN-containing dehydrogenase
MTEEHWVNDVHSRLNPTPVTQILTPDSVAMVKDIIKSAKDAGRILSIAGGRHAMGGQQFGTHGWLCDMTQMDAVRSFDTEAGLIEIEAGIEWPALIDYLERVQGGHEHSWTIAQKQTGANALSIGGAVSANIHGRGLKMQPFISDVESLELIYAQRETRRCSRTKNAELFRLVAGGYGLFGIITAVTLRLVPRRKLRRVVEIVAVQDLMACFDQRIAAGFLYGDFQFVTNETSPDFLRLGVFSCYAPVADDTPFPEQHKHLTPEDWRRLVYLAHTDKARAFDLYSRHYLATSGQVYWSDRHQEAVYLDDYHQELNTGAAPGSEMITEIYVPRTHLADFLAEIAEDFRLHKTNLIYGTVRLIEQDTDSVLAWAKEAYACVIFNLHVEHTPQGIAHAAQAFRRLIDRAIRRRGSYYLAYHRYATRAQLETCYPQFSEFLRWKRIYDPEERFGSDWYRHHCALFPEVESA